MELCYKKLDAIKYLWIRSGLKYIFVGDNRKRLEKNSALPDITSIDIFGIPPYIYVLTYYNLIFDIHDFAKGENERTSLFKTILNALKWEKGYVFIPCTRRVAKDIQPDKKSFWLKIEELKKQGHNITHVLIFGKDAKDVLLEDVFCSMPYGVDRYKNFTVLSMPSPEDMLPDNRKAKNIVWNFLKQLKRPLT